MSWIGNPMAAALLAVLLLLSCSREAAGSKGLFILEKSEQPVWTDAGVVRVVRGVRSLEHPHPIDLAFITMEPSTLFVPQYLDSCIVVFVQIGEAKISWIYNDELVEKELKHGDINRIPAGSTFYIVNTGKTQRLQIIGAIDTSDSLIYGSTYNAFFIGGGLYPKSILAGFDLITLATAYNVTPEEVTKVLGTPTGGPIVFNNGKAPELNGEIASIIHGKMRWTEKEYQSRTWSPRSLLLGGENDRRGKSGAVQAPDSYSLFDREPGYKNKYGSSTSLDERDYHPLTESGVGVYYVFLTAGAMMAPHVNPIADEYGVVLNGSGTIQIVYPNGTLAMNAEVHRGDVFWVPRYFPFCHIASPNSPLELFGFTTSAKPNRPQFLAGRKSVLTSMMGPELAAGFGTTEEELRKFVGSQEFEVILPAWPPTEDGGEEPTELNKMTGA